jgi:hypothetical protein
MLGPIRLVLLQACHPHQIGEFIAYVKKTNSAALSHLRYLGCKASSPHQTRQALRKGAVFSHLLRPLFLTSSIERHVGYLNKTQERMKRKRKRKK